MTLIKKSTLKNIISDSRANSIDYNTYRDLVSNLVAHNSTTGKEKTEALINYTLLNDRRMKRWDKTVKLPEDSKLKIKAFHKKMTWLVITESWCGDAAHIMPVINKVADLNTNIDYKVVLRDENEALINKFLTNGGKAIPKLIIIDNITNEVINTYGPRPSVATKMVNSYKAKHGKLSPRFKEDLQRWYNKDKGQSTLADLLNFLD